MHPKHSLIWVEFIFKVIIVVKIQTCWPTNLSPNIAFMLTQTKLTFCLFIKLNLHLSFTLPSQHEGLLI